MACATRPLLETTVRQLVLKNYLNIRVIGGTPQSFVGKGSREVLDGMNVSLSTGGDTFMPATLVGTSVESMYYSSIISCPIYLDCTGAVHTGVKWLKELHPQDTSCIESLP